MRIRTPQGLVAAVLMAISAGGGCDCAAPRGKPWRHDPDPQSLAAAQPRSAALTADEEAVGVLAERGHTLRIHMDAEPRGLNPLTAPSVWARRITLGPVFEPLIRYLPPPDGAGSGPGTYSPGLARSWRIMPGGLEIRFLLEPGVTFHDGRRMTSSDVQFTLDLIRSPSSKIDHLRPLLANIDAVELVTSKEIRLVLHEPDGWILRTLAEIPILPMHVYQGNLGADGKIIGTGPWQLVSRKDGIIHLGRYGGYWGAEPAIADVEFVYQPDAARALTDAKRGAIDIVPALIPEHWPEQASAPGIAAAFAPLELRPPRMRYMVFDCTAPPTDDARVRKAISLLVDRKKLARDIYDGLARPVAGPVWPGGPGDGPAPPAPELDPVEAARLLDDAGWTDSDGDGTRDKAGVKLSLDALLVERPSTGRRKADPERTLIFESLKRAGFSIVVRDGSEGVIANRVRDGDFDVALLELAQPVDMDLTPLLGTGGRVNHGKCSSARIDAALAALDAEWVPPERAKRIGELAAAVADALPIAGLVEPSPQGLVHRRVGGLVVWDGWFDLRTLTLSTEQE